MEEELEKIGFDSLAIIKPAMIYPGNSNSPQALGWLNQKLNWILPGVINSVSCAEIAQAMDLTMRQQMAGAVSGKVLINGGLEVTLAADPTSHHN
jgi:hypothetical protein